MMMMMMMMTQGLGFCINLLETSLISRAFHKKMEGARQEKALALVGHLSSLNIPNSTYISGHRK